MKHILWITLIFFTFGSYAQNSFPPSGEAFVSGKIISSIADEIGGHLELRNPAKTANGTAKSWIIFNMSGSYGNSLQFWAYDNLGCVSGGMCASRFTIMDNGNVGVGILNPSDKLAVNGKIRAKEVKVESANWPDFVFAKDYVLPTLQETEKHIKEKGHLPGIPSAAEVEKNGIELGDMNKKLLQKIEELTLYLIEMKKDNEASRRDSDAKNKALQDQINKLNSKQR